MAVDFDSGATLADRMRRHGDERQHLYGHLMRAMADDWEAGGPVREICRGWEDSPPGSVVQLRLLAGLFRLVLTGRAPELVPYYPCLGGNRPPEQAWPVVRAVLGRHVAELRAGLDTAPQTNEVGRSAALLVGLFEAVRQTRLSAVRLLEPGASAGLNLLVDRFRFVNPSWSAGPADSPLVIKNTVVGPVEPADVEIVSRRGCDLAPVDASTADGRLRLRSFVWPFQTARHDRLVAALEIAQRWPVEVDRAGAGEWLESRLAEPVDDGVLTVVWHSITRMYWPEEETARVEAAIRSAAGRVPVAEVSMEYPDSGGDDRPALTVGVAGAGGADWQTLRLAEVGDHGTPVTLVDR